MSDEPRDHRPLSSLRLSHLQEPGFRGKTDEEVQAIARGVHETCEGLKLAALAEMEVERGGWGVAPRHLKAALSADETPEAIGWIRHFMARPELVTLVLWGGPGAGKTVAGVFWLTQVAKRWKETSYFGRTWTWDRSARFIDAGWVASRGNSYDRQDRSVIRDVEQARFLVLDDLGTELESPAQRQAIEHLISVRNSSELLTVITTNKRPEELEAYGARAISRLKQGGEFHGCGAVDLRRVKP